MDRNGLSKLRKLSRILTVFVAMVFLCSCTGEPQKPADIQGDGYAYTKEWATWYITNKLIKNGKVPSVVMALVDDQEVVWQEAFGYANLEEEIFASVDTVYKMASVTKPFSALAIMKLYEDGVIDLDVPITDYLPDFSIKTRFPDSDPITIRSILSHRGGFPHPENRLIGESLGLEPFERISLKEIVDALKDDYVAYPVGSRYNYSSVGFIILGRIIEVVTGRDYSDYMEENILNPLSMSDSTFFSSSVEEGKITPGYYIDNKKTEALPLRDYSGLPATGLYSTLSDMTKYLKFLFREGEVDGKQLIGQETLEMMYVDSYSRPRDPVTMGLSWGLFPLSTGHITAGHGGDLPGFQTFINFLPEEKLGIIIMANIQDVLLAPLGVKALELMLESKSGIKPVEQTIPEAVQVDRATLEKYTGKYALGFGFPIEITLKNNMLQLIFPIDDQLGIKARINLIPITERKFRFPPLIGEVVGANLEFFVGDEDEEDLLIWDDLRSPFDLSCPRLPKVEEIPPLWNELKGEYTIETSYIEKELAKLEVKIVNNVLTAVFISTSLPYPPIPLILNPINDREIIIVAGPLFTGATLFYDNDTGYISGIGVIMKPND